MRVSYTIEQILRILAFECEITDYFSVRLSEI